MWYERLGYKKGYRCRLFFFFLEYGFTMFNYYVMSKFILYGEVVGRCFS